MKTIEYLEKVKERTNAKTDYAVAKLLGLSTAGMSQYRTGKRVIDDYTAAKVANVLDINPLEVIAAANAEREKDSQKAEFWRKLASGAQAAAVGSTLFFGGLTYSEEFLNNQHYIHYAQLLAVVVFALVLIWRKHEKEEDGV